MLISNKLGKYSNMKTLYNGHFGERGKWMLLQRGGKGWERVKYLKKKMLMIAGINVQHNQNVSVKQTPSGTSKNSLFQAPR